MIILRQKLFNNKVQKALRNAHDIKLGKEFMKKMESAGLKSELGSKQEISAAKKWGREIQQDPGHGKDINSKISKKGRIRDYQKDGTFDKYTADTMVQDTISPDLSTRILIRNSRR